MNPTAALHSTRTAQQLAGVSTKQIDHWVRSGHLTPARPAAGSGTHMGFSDDDITRLRVMRRLVELGASATVAGHAAHCDLQRGRWLVVNRGATWITDDLLEVLAYEGGGLVLDLSVELPRLGPPPAPPQLVGGVQPPLPLDEATP